MSHRSVGAVLFASALLLGACSAPALPPHVHDQGSNNWAPEPGYAWIDSDATHGVRWSPGATHPTYPHIFAMATENNWGLEEGYAWATATTSDLHAVWTPSMAHSQFAHVHALDQEGSWGADPGYAFPTAGMLSAVIWKPGARHPSFAHVSAMADEGYWRTDPGYTFSRDGDLSSASWTPGTANPTYQHVYADDQPDTWRPESGYTFANTTEGDFTVVASDSGDPGDKLGRFLGDMVIAMVANAVATPQENDGLIARGLVRPGAGHVRDEALKAAVGEVVN